MISSEYNPKNTTTCDVDFRLRHYWELCRLAVKNYPIASYQQIPWGNSFCLWRHDIDFSLNRGLALAKIEHEIGIKATYFLNPHCEFYNLAEAGQHAIVKEILSLDHDIGLHFDAGFFGEISEVQLNDLIAREADYLYCLFDVKPVAFSFHNPVASTLAFEADSYGGLINCYSKRLKTEVPYCSDSNGYWRFRRLYNVLSEAKDPCLQVLTHPGWWQDKSMSPRQRIFRSAYGRAVSIIRLYDKLLEQYSRFNHSGLASSLRVLKESLGQQYDLFDFLWNQGAFQTLFFELWSLHEAQINRLSKAKLIKEWTIPASEVNAFFVANAVAVDGWCLFEALFETHWHEATDISEYMHKDWVKVRNYLIYARSPIASAKIERGCVYLCEVMSNLAAWGLMQPFKYDGLADLDSIGLPTVKSASGSSTDVLVESEEVCRRYPNKRWSTFNEEIANLRKWQKSD